MVCMIKRLLNPAVLKIIEKGLSVLILGPRQTGKTTLIKEILADFDYLEYNFMNTRERKRLERDPALIIDEISGSGKKFIFIDEIQKVPELLDNIQIVMDNEKKIFLITGSSARKLKRGEVNLLPGRSITLEMFPLLYNEYSVHLKGKDIHSIKNILKYGELPRVLSLVVAGESDIAEELLYSYVDTYLEEEIRAEALVRKIGLFSSFLKLAAEDSGRVVSFRNLSQDLGIPHQKISEYYGILEDCLIVRRIDSLVPESQRGKSMKSPKFVFFDTGVVNAASGVLGPSDYHSEYWARLFEQWAGLTISRFLRAKGLRSNLHYWRDYSGREVDWVIEYRGHWFPIEVKWGEEIRKGAAKHLNYFLDNFQDKAKKGFIVYTGRNPVKISDRIIALPWCEMSEKIYQTINPKKSI